LAKAEADVFAVRQNLRLVPRLDQIRGATRFESLLEWRRQTRHPSISAAPPTNASLANAAGQDYKTMSVAIWQSITT